jgi:hypothetical protein
VAVDRAGNVFVADIGDNDCRNSRIVVFSAAGEGARGRAVYVPGVTVDGAGNVFVADWDNHRIVIFSAGGGAGLWAGGQQRGRAQEPARAWRLTGRATSPFIPWTGLSHLTSLSLSLVLPPSLPPSDSLSLALSLALSLLLSLSLSLFLSLA